jgi:hypothetical protein
MKTVLIAISVVGGTSLFAQDGVIEPGNIIQQLETKKAVQLKLSPTPTVQEITDAFRMASSGQMDPFKVIHQVAERGDNAMPALSEFLFLEATAPEPVTVALTDDRTVISLPSSPDRIYAAIALEAIGTKLAFETLVKAAATHKVEDVRAYALKTLARSFADRFGDQQEQPDKGLLHVFLRYADDPTEAKQFQKTFGEIAREGLRNWADIDLGALDREPEYVNVNGQAITKAEYRELWWQENKEKLSWNMEMGRFELRN